VIASSTLYGDKAAVAEPPAKSVLGPFRLRVVRGPPLERLIQELGARPVLRPHLAAVLEEGTDQVGFVPVRSRGECDRARHAEPVLKPPLAALHGPRENAGELGAQAVAEELVLFRCRDGDREGNEPNPAPDAVVGAPDH